MPRSIVIVGAGSKAAAIVARAAVLRRARPRMDHPNITVIEQTEIGANWNGVGGYASGFQTLCTPAEKDVGYPYRDSEALLGDEIAVGREMAARFSWQAYLVANNLFAEWIERGRDFPTHAQWADYLKWVFNEAEIEPQIATVPDGGIRRVGEEWVVSFDRAGAAVKEEVEANHVVLTGPGATFPPLVQTEAIPDSRYLNGMTFWEKRNDILPAPGRQIVVIGGGGGAGAILAWLAERFSERKVRILSLTREGTLFPRGDGFSERRWFSIEPDTKWRSLSVAQRRGILGRTEGGVVSLRNKAIVDASNDVSYEIGEAQSVKWIDSGMETGFDYGGTLEIIAKHDKGFIAISDADYIIDARGFNLWGLFSLLETSLARPLSVLNSRQRDSLERRILEDLSIPKFGRRGTALSRFPSGLHVPALGWLNYGPGIGNLGALGMMATRILEKRPVPPSRPLVD